MRSMRCCPPGYWLLLEFHQPHHFHRIVPFPPRVEPAFERTHTGDAVFFEDQRRTGAASFVWSSAVEDHVAISRDLQMPLLQLFSVEPQRSGDFRAIGRYFLRC